MGFTEVLLVDCRRDVDGGGVMGPMRNSKATSGLFRRAKTPFGIAAYTNMARTRLAVMQAWSSESHGHQRRKGHPLCL